MSNPVRVVAVDAAYKGIQDNRTALSDGFRSVSLLSPQLGETYALIPVEGKSTLDELKSAIPWATTIQVDHPDDLSKPAEDRRILQAVRVSKAQLRALEESSSKESGSKESGPIIKVVQTFPAPAAAAPDLPNRSQSVLKGDEGPAILVLAA